MKNIERWNFIRTDPDPAFCRILRAGSGSGFSIERCIRIKVSGTLADLHICSPYPVSTCLCTELTNYASCFSNQTARSFSCLKRILRKFSCNIRNISSIQTRASCDGEKIGLRSLHKYAVYSSGFPSIQFPAIFFLQILLS